MGPPFGVCVGKPRSQRSTSSIVTQDPSMDFDVFIVDAVHTCIQRILLISIHHCLPLPPPVPYHFLSQGLSLGPGAYRVG